MEKHVDMSYIIFQSEQIFYFDSIATTPLHVKVCHKYYGEIRSTYFSTEYVISWLQWYKNHDKLFQEDTTSEKSKS